MLSFLLFVVLVSACQAQIPFFAACPNVTTVSSFQAEKYMGKWYEAEKYFAIFEFGGKCVTAEYALGEDGIVTVHNEEISSISGDKSTIDGTAKLVGNADEAKLSVNFPSLPVNFDAPYWVLDTDYDTYSVVWSCSDFGIISTRIAWILTREQNPSVDVMEKAYAALDKENISKAYLLRTDQTNCPSDNSSKN